MKENDGTFEGGERWWGACCDGLFGGLKDGFIICRMGTDEDDGRVECRVLAVNPAFERLMSVEGKAVAGGPVRAFCPELEQVFLKTYREVSSGGGALRTVCRFDKVDRSFEIDSYSPAEGHVVAVISDLSERTREREENRRLQSQLLQAQKMEAIGRLAGGVAHDFNNLLTAVQGYADLAMLQFGNQTIVKESLEQIKKAAERAAKLSHQLLIFSRKEPMELKPMDINDIVRNLGDMLKRIIGENIAIGFELGAGPLVARVNKGQIEQVVMNLAVNARDAMPSGGRLAIRTESVNAERDPGRPNGCTHRGMHICLSVADSGTGMNKETAAHIFEPFFTTKKSGEGTGLGLSVVYGIVEEHGGWVSVFSEPGAGSIFKVYLPETRERAAEPDKAVPARGNLRGKGEKVLLVEDDRSILSFMEKRLAEEGYVVLSAENVGDALRVNESEKRPFDLLFTDVVLPDKTGIDLILKLHAQNPRLKVLLTSGYDYTQSEWPSLEGINVQFIRKPYTVNGLLLAIRSSLDEFRGERG